MTLRRLGQIDTLIARRLERPLTEKLAPVEDVLRLGMAQLLFLDTPAYAAIDTAVALTRALGFEPQAGLVNAVLRRINSEGKALVATQDAARLNAPEFLWRDWVKAYGKDTAQAIAAAHLGEPPLDISCAGDARDWAARLDAKLLPTGTLRRDFDGRIEELPGFSAGTWWVQDAAAALPAKLLQAQPFDRVLDLCAAPGGKTLQLAAFGASVTAVERSPRRAAMIGENLARCRLTAAVITGDASDYAPEAPFAKVLLDAPCSATGTIRRHPDIARRRGTLDFALLTAAQDKLLDAALRLTAPGGVLVYAVCSLEPAEGPERIAALLARGATVERVPIAPAEIGGITEAITPLGDLRTLPSQLAELGGWDGFYACRLRRN